MMKPPHTRSFEYRGQKVVITKSWTSTTFINVGTQTQEVEVCLINGRDRTSEVVPLGVASLDEWEECAKAYIDGFFPDPPPGIERIDKELERLRKAGLTPRRIDVGSRLYWEIQDMQNPVGMAPVVGPSGSTPIHVDKDVKEYQGIQVFVDVNADKDFLEIIT